MPSRHVSMYLFMYPTVPTKHLAAIHASPSVLVNATSLVRNEGRAHIAETKYLSRKNGAEDAREPAWARRWRRSPKRADGTVPREIRIFKNLTCCPVGMHCEVDKNT